MELTFRGNFRNGLTIILSNYGNLWCTADVVGIMLFKFMQKLVIQNKTDISSFCSLICGGFGCLFKLFFLFPIAWTQNSNASLIHTHAHCLHIIMYLKLAICKKKNTLISVIFIRFPVFPSFPCHLILQ